MSTVPTKEGFLSDVREFIRLVQMNELDTKSNLKGLIIACTPYLNTGASVNMITFPKNLFDENEIRKELGYTEEHDNSAPSWRHDEAFYYVSVPGNELHMLYEKIYRDYNTLYGVERSAAQKAASNALRMAIMEERAPDSIRDMITLTKKWLEEVKERIERPSNTTVFSYVSKPVKLPENILNVINGMVIGPVESAIRKADSSPITYTLYRSFREDVKSAFNVIALNKGLMAILEKDYQRLYRAFAKNHGSLTKKDGSNLFNSRNSREFITRLFSMSGGKRKIKRTAKKQPKQKRRRTVRR